MKRLNINFIFLHFLFGFYIHFAHAGNVVTVSLDPSSHNGGELVGGYIMANPNPEGDIILKTRAYPHLSDPAKVTIELVKQDQNPFLCSGNFKVFDINSSSQILNRFTEPANCGDAAIYFHLDASELNLEVNVVKDFMIAWFPLTTCDEYVQCVGWDFENPSNSVNNTNGYWFSKISVLYQQTTIDPDGDEVPEDFVSIVEPNSYTVWASGDEAPLTVEHSKDGVFVFDIYKTDGTGAVYSGSFNGVGIRTDHYFSIPSSIPHGNYKLRVHLQENSQIWDDSEVFEIRDPNQNGSYWINFDSPTSSTKVMQEEFIDVSWTTNYPYDHFDLALFKEGNQFVTSMVEGQTGSSYSWRIPRSISPGQSYQVRLFLIQTGQDAEFQYTTTFEIEASDEPIVIQDFRVSKPYEGVSWHNGQEEDVFWLNPTGYHGAARVYLLKGDEVVQEIGYRPNTYTSTTNYIDWKVPLQIEPDIYRVKVKLLGYNEGPNEAYSSFFPIGNLNIENEPINIQNEVSEEYGNIESNGFIQGAIIPFSECRVYQDRRLHELKATPYWNGVDFHLKTIHSGQLCPGVFALFEKDENNILNEVYRQNVFGGIHGTCLRDDETISIPYSIFANQQSSKYVVGYKGDISCGAVQYRCFDPNNCGEIGWSYFGDFVITIGEVDIEYPDGADDFHPGQNFYVYWHSPERFVGGDYTITLLKDGYVVSEIETGTLSGSPLGRSVPLPSNIENSGSYQVKVSLSKDNLFLSGTSNFFTVSTLGGFDIRYPDGQDDTFQEGRWFYVDWLSPQDYIGGSYSIHLLKAGELVQEEPLMTGTVNEYQTGVLPYFPSTLVSGNDYQVRVTLEKYGVSISSESNNFWVSGTGSPPIQCVITNPSPGTAGYDELCSLIQRGYVISREDILPYESLTREDMGLMIAKALFRDGIQSPARDFPTFRAALRNTGFDAHKDLIALSYLSYGDGVTPFDRDESIRWKLGDPIEKKFYTKFLLEAYNIPTGPIDLPGISYPPSLGLTDTEKAYLNRAYEMGLLNTPEDGTVGNDVHEPIVRFHAMLMLERLEAYLEQNGAQFTKPDKALLESINPYDVPMGYDLFGILGGFHEEQGVFTYGLPLYNIPDYRGSLSFLIGYNSFKAYFPDEIHTFSELGGNRGWYHNFQDKIVLLPKMSSGNSTETSSNQGEEAYAARILPDGSTAIWTWNEQIDQFSPKSRGLFDELSYNFGNSVLEIRDKMGNTMEYTHQYSNTEGNKVYDLTRITDAYGNIWNISYETGEAEVYKGKSYTPTRIALVASPAGNSLVFQYHNGSNKLYRITNNDLGIHTYSQFEYFANGNLRQTHEVYSDASSYKYHDNSSIPQRNYNFEYVDHEGKSLLYYIQKPKGNWISVSYQDGRTKEVQVREAGTLTVNRLDYAVNKGVGEPLNYNTVGSQISGGKTTYSKYSYDYDPNGGLRKTKEISHNSNENEENGIETSYSYGDDQFNYLPTQTITNDISTRYIYGSFGRLEEVEVNSGGDIIREQWSFGNNSFPLSWTQHISPEGQITDREFSNGGDVSLVSFPNGTQSTSQFDQYGRLVSSQNPAGIISSFESYIKGAPRIIKVAGEIVNEIQYDGWSRTISASSGNRTSQVKLDLQGRVFYSKTPEGRESTIKYDLNGNTETITNPIGQATSFTYDDLDRIKTMTYDEKSYVYTYDGTRLSSLQRRSGSANEKFNYTYYDGENEAGWLKSDGYANIIYNQDKSSIHYGNVMRVEKASGGSNSAWMSYSYDHFNRTSGEDSWWREQYNIGAGVSYSYNKNGQTTEIDYGGDKVLLHHYNDAGRLERLQAMWLPGQPNIISYVYDHSTGRLGYKEFGNGLREYWEFDYRGRKSEIRLTSNGSVVGKMRFTYNLHSELTGIEKFGWYEDASNPETRVYDIDFNQANNQASFFDLSFPTINASSPINYDGNGQITQTLDASEIYWDMAGNMTVYINHEGYREFEYDGMGNLRGVIRPNDYEMYVLDTRTSLPRRLKTMNGSTSTRYFFIHGLDGLAARIDANGNISYYHFNHRGDTRFITNQNQTVTHSYSYTDWGECYDVQENGPTNRFRFTGQFGVAFESSNLYHMGARKYHPQMGRFYSEDPIWGENLFSYANGNPQQYIDPDGEFAHIAIGAGVGGIIGIAGQGVSDLISGEFSGWESYTGAFVGGAIVGGVGAATGGLSLVGNVALAAGASAAENLTTQTLSLVSGRKNKFDLKSFTLDTFLVGPVSGLIPGVNIKGITNGRGSYKAIKNMLFTKLREDQISRISMKSFRKILSSSIAEEGPGELFESAINISNRIINQ